jgi:hypothetical protein
LDDDVCLDEIGSSGWSGSRQVYLPKPIPLSDLLKRIEAA